MSDKNIDLFHDIQICLDVPVFISDKSNLLSPIF